jgi:hypothetical protein
MSGAVAAQSLGAVGSVAAYLQMIYPPSSGYVSSTIGSPPSIPCGGPDDQARSAAVATAIATLTGTLRATLGV